MKNKLKTTLLLALALSMYCFSGAANARSVDDLGEDTRVHEISTDEVGKCTGYDDDGMSELIPLIISLRDNANSIDELVRDIQSIPVYTTQNTNHAMKIKISDVQIFNSNLDLEDGIQALSGDLKSGMVAKVFYDEGESWIQFAIKPQKPDNYDNVSPYANEHGFILPLDTLDLDPTDYYGDLTCRFGCEKDGITLCDWCVLHNQGYAQRPHNGLDFSWSGISGTLIRAIDKGEAISSFSKANGNYVYVTHENGYISKYLHMNPHMGIEGYVAQGTIIGKVGTTGQSSAPHLHLQIEEISTSEPIDPLILLKGAGAYVPTFTTASDYLIVDGPLKIRKGPSTSYASAGTIENGTTVKISKIQPSECDYIFGYISSGTYSGNWVAIGTEHGEIYAANMTNTWTVFDGPINVRASASTSSGTSGNIARGGTFNITNVTKNGDYLFGQIASYPAPDVNGGTCPSKTAIGKWVALDYCTVY